MTAVLTLSDAVTDRAVTDCSVTCKGASCKILKSQSTAFSDFYAQLLQSSIKTNDNCIFFTNLVADKKTLCRKVFLKIQKWQGSKHRRLGGKNREEYVACVNIT